MEKYLLFLIFKHFIHFFLLISITLLPNNGYYAKSHIVQAINLKQDDSRLPKTS